MGLLVVLYFVAEIVVTIRVFEAFGFINTAFALLCGFVLGAGIIRNQGRYLLLRAQEAAARGEPLNDQLMHGMMNFLAGILLIFPGFICKLIAILLLLPGTRHLLMAFGRRRLERQFSSGQFRVFTFRGGAGGFSAGYRGPRPDTNAETESVSQMRDVSPKVIDVTPLSSEHHVKESDESES